MDNSIYMTTQQEKKYRRFLWALLLAGIAALLWTVYFSYWQKIPSKIKIRAGVEQEFDFRVPVSGEIYRTAEEVAAVSSVTDVDEGAQQALSGEAAAESIHVDFAHRVRLKANAIDSYQMDLKLFGVLPYKNVDIEVIQDKMLIPSGMPIGIYVKTDGVLVVGIGEFESSEGETVSPAKYVLQKGDYILKCNGEAVENKKHFISMVEASEGEDLVLTIRRNNEITAVMLRGEANQMKEWKLGIWIRDNAQGIGTMTYEGTDYTFGALGHGINDVDTSILMNLEEGTLYRTEIVGITRGANGAPGELTGYIEYDSDNVIGEITENTAEGIFGVCDNELVESAAYEPIPIALKQEIEMGPAQIICSVSGEPEFYDVEIVEVDLEHENVNRGIVIRVVDEKLLMLTGGIIQGMLLRYNRCKQGNPVFMRVCGVCTFLLTEKSRKILACLGRRKILAIYSTVKNKRRRRFFMVAKELKVYRGSGRNYTSVPQIIIQGKWLRPLGFFVGDKVTVTQEGNRLIIEKSGDGHGAEEEAAMTAKPVRRYPEPLGRIGGWI